MKIFIRSLVLALAFIPCNNLLATSFFASSAQDIIQFRSQVKSGDTIVLANKTWVDSKIEIQFTRTSKPVIVMPQTIGGVVFTGNSTLNVAGEYTIFEDFTFKLINPLFENISTGTLGSQCETKATTVKTWEQYGKMDN